MTLSRTSGSVWSTEIALLMSGHYKKMLRRLRHSHPNAISFVNPPVFEEPPNLEEDLKRGRVALSSHFYDGMTMLGKRE